MGKQTIQRWRIEDLVALVPGSTRARWEIEYLPGLIAAGALAADADGWLGRRHEIEVSLMLRPSGLSSPTLRQDSELHRWLRWLHMIAEHATYPNAAIALATGGMSLALHLVVAVPLLVLGAGLLAGRFARPLERP